MRVRLMSLVMIAATASLPLSAQEKPAPAPVVVDKILQSPSRREPPAPIPLKVTVVLSRYQGEKRISSMPYSMGVTASGLGPAPKTTLRMGVDVPVTTTVFGAEGKAPVASYQYRNIGTNIDCSASFESTAPGTFQLTFTVSDSSIGLDSSKKSDTPGVVPDIPSFRNFNSSFTALLRDGQTTQYTSATDPVTGDLMKIDVTLNVMK
jgi:hypothetical protein